jgi:hypothetical protein
MDRSCPDWALWALRARRIIWVPGPTGASGPRPWQHASMPFWSRTRAVVVVAVVAGLHSSPPADAFPAAVDCGFFFPKLPTTPPSAGARDAGSQEPINGGALFVEFPPVWVGAVPRNVELRLGGALDELDQGFWEVGLEGGAGSIFYEREGDRILPQGGLLPAGEVVITIAPSESNPCPSCWGVWEQTLSVDDVVDLEPPAFTSVVVHELVPPSMEEQTRCNQFLGESDFIALAFMTDETTEVTFAARHERVPVQLMLSAGTFSLAGTWGGTFLQLGASPPVAVGDDVFASVVLRDLAGNVSAPHNTRIRAQALRGLESPDISVDQIPERRCTLAPGPVVFLPEHLPQNPVLRVVFPLEEYPLVVASGSTSIPLLPDDMVADDVGLGRLYVPAQPLLPGPWELQSLPCERCVCPDCLTPLRLPLVVDDVVDQAAPRPPVVLEVLEDSSPAPAAGECTPDRAALLLVLAPGEDDHAGPYDLLYDVTVAIRDDPPRPVGTAIVPQRRADGAVVLRLPTHRLGRLIGEPLRFSVTARDPAGHRARAVHEHAGDVVDTGCASTTAPTSWLVLAAFFVVVGRRTRSHRRRP